MPLACRVHWSWVYRTGDTMDTVKEPLRRRARHATDQLFVDDQLQTFWQHLKCSLTTTETWRTWKSSGIFLFLFTQPAVWAWETWYSAVWASPPLASAGQQLWYLADGRMLFTFTLSNAESRGGRMNLKVLANVRRGWTDCRAATLTFFFFMLTRRGRGLRERWDKILRWRHSKIHCTHYDARRRETAWVFPETLEVRAGTWGSWQFQTQRASYRTD